MTLRPYQAEAVESGSRFMQTEPGKAAIIVAPAGSGKSHLIAGIAKKVRRGGKGGTLWAVWSNGRQLTNVNMEK